MAKAAKQVRIASDDDSRTDSENDDVPFYKSQNVNRSLIREKSEIAHGVRESLQTCTLSENRGKIEAKLETVIKPPMRRNLHVLQYILDCLTAKVPLNGNASMLSFMKFDEAFNIYKSFFTAADNISRSDKELKDHLRILLCHPEFGLCIYLLRVIGSYCKVF